MERDKKVTPITRNEPRTFYATRVSHTPAGEMWDLWTVTDSRRVGTLMILDDGICVYGVAAVRKGTDQEELTDLMDGLYPVQCTQATRQEFLVVEYDEEPKIFDKNYEG